MLERVFELAARFEREHAWVQVAAERSVQHYIHFTAGWTQATTVLTECDSSIQSMDAYPNHRPFNSK